MFGKLKSEISAYFQESSALLDDVIKDIALQKAIDDTCRLCIEAYKTNHKILVAGNGGSAADAQHFAGELVSRFYFDRTPLAAIALTTDTSILTAIGNDYGFNQIFSRQILANGLQGDIFFGISTSGNSENILRAAEVCQALGIKVIGLLGNQGGKMKDLCDVCIIIPSISTPRIQECHLIIEHIICAVIGKSLFGENNI